MALIQCPECSSSISDEAQACPHCGYPLATQIRSEQVREIDRKTAVPVIVAAILIAGQFFFVGSRLLPCWTYPGEDALDVEMTSILLTGSEADFAHHVDRMVRYSEADCTLDKASTQRRYGEILVVAPWIAFFGFVIWWVRRGNQLRDLSTSAGDSGQPSSRSADFNSVPWDERPLTGAAEAIIRESAPNNPRKQMELRRKTWHQIATEHGDQVPPVEPPDPTSTSH